MKPLKSELLNFQRWKVTPPLLSCLYITMFCCWRYSGIVAPVNCRLKYVTASRFHLEVIDSSMKYVCPKAAAVGIIYPFLCHD